VNHVTKLDNYLTPKTEDLVATIGEGEKFSILIYQINQIRPRQLPTVARQGLKFLFKNLLKPPIYPQVAIKFVLKNVKWWGSYNIIWQMIPTVAHPIWKKKTYQSILNLSIKLKSFHLLQK